MGPSRGTQLSLFGLLSDEHSFVSERTPSEPASREHLVPVHDEPARASIEHFLRERVPFPVRVVVTDNTRTMLSVCPRGAVRDVRLHHMFLDAPTPLLHSLAQYVQSGDPQASRVIDGYIANQQHRVRPPAPLQEQRPLRPRGRVYELREVQRELSETYFDARLQLPITWGSARSRPQKPGTRRTLRLGAYLLEERLIRVHPALDQPFVPAYFLGWVVYHEMLHHEIPMSVVQGRRVYHPPEFRRRERQYVDYERARSWERANLHRLVP